jgi:hypothetical protein
MNSELKEKYIEMIDGFKDKPPLLQILKAFIQSYDGSDNPKLHTLILGIIATEIQLTSLNVKAAAYEDLAKGHEEQFDKIEDILDEQGDLEEEDIPVPVKDGENE